MIGSVPSTPPAQISDPRDMADANTFMTLLATQLANQDPLSPMDNGAFVAQLAQFSSLEQAQAMNKNLSEMVALQRLTQAGGLIGRNVEYLSDGVVARGRIEAVALTGDAMTFTINGETVAPGMLLRVLADPVQ